MTAQQFARICQDFRAELCAHPSMARYLEQRDAYERRRLGLPVKETAR
jgi:hypothetical protein